MSKAILCKLIGLFVLSVAVAACSSDSGSNGGSSGSGGGGGGGGEMVDQCVNEPDKGYVESGTIHEAARACGAGECLEIVVKLFTGTPTDEDIEAAATCITECVLADSNVDGVSEGCAGCFGIQGSCGAVAGCLECSNPDSCKCVECLDDSGCQAEVDACTGVIREFECTP